MKSSFLERLISKKARLEKLKKRVIDYLSSIPSEKLPADQKVILEYLKENNIAVFPYSFTKEYIPAGIHLSYDPDVNLYYTLWEGKKLYHKRTLRKSKAKKYFNSLRLEQDVRSPHLYLTEDFNINGNDVIVDVGAAEGNFSLSVVEKAGFIYLFETDTKWIKALHATFAPWKHKVKIISKYVSDKSDGDNIRLDDFFQENDTINFIKADVEGAEERVLRGAAKTIAAQQNIKIAVCTYHQQEDAEILDSLLREFGFTNEFSNGYMLYYYGRENVVKEPYVRKAVLRAVKK